MDSELSTLERSLRASPGDIQLIRRVLRSYARAGRDLPYALRVEETDLYTTIGVNSQGMTEFRHRTTGTVFVLVPAGSFMMGSGENKVERTFSEPFLMAKYPWTGREWYRITGELPSHFPTNAMVHSAHADATITPEIRLDLPDQHERKWGDHPVESVSWERCREVTDWINRIDFTRRFNAPFSVDGGATWTTWLDYASTAVRRDDGEFAVPHYGRLVFSERVERLYEAWLWNRNGERCGFQIPSESMWEYAARAGATTRFPNGDSEELLSEIAWVNGEWDDGHKAVGLKKPNNWGLHDNCGNVFEWTRCRWLDDISGQDKNGFTAVGESARTVSFISDEDIEQAIVSAPTSGPPSVQEGSVPTERDGGPTSGPADLDGQPIPGSSSESETSTSAITQAPAPATPSEQSSGQGDRPFGIPGASTLIQPTAGTLPGPSSAIGETPSSTPVTSSRRTSPCSSRRHSTQEISPSPQGVESVATSAEDIRGTQVGSSSTGQVNEVAGVAQSSEHGAAGERGDLTPGRPFSPEPGLTFSSTPGSSASSPCHSPSEESSSTGHDTDRPNSPTEDPHGTWTGDQSTTDQEPALDQHSPEVSDVGGERGDRPFGDLSTPSQLHLTQSLMQHVDQDPTGSSFLQPSRLDETSIDPSVASLPEDSPGSVTQPTARSGTRSTRNMRSARIAEEELLGEPDDPFVDGGPVLVSGPPTENLPGSSLNSCSNERPNTSDHSPTSQSDPSSGSSSQSSDAVGRRSSQTEPQHVEETASPERLDVTAPAPGPLGALGNWFRRLLSGGGISSRGVGSVEPSTGVISEFQLMTFDIVPDHAVVGAYPRVDTRYLMCGNAWETRGFETPRIDRWNMPASIRGLRAAWRTRP